jgi:hypothetical protein
MRIKKRGLAVLMAVSFAAGFGANSVANEVRLTPEERHDRMLDGWENEYEGWDFHDTDGVNIMPGDNAWNTAVREVSVELGITMDEARNIVGELNPGVKIGELQPGDKLNVPRFAGDDYDEGK